MRSYTITTVWGIPIKINTSLVIFLPILAWLIGSGQRIELYANLISGFAPTTLNVNGLQSGLTPWIIGVTVSIGLFISVAIHELGHSWVARRYGIHIESITLWIFGGVAGMESIPREWHKEFWIAVAGPITSVLLAGVFYLLLQVIPPVSSIVLFNVGSLAIVNLTLAAFNLLPAFPMDGGRIFRALLSRSRSYVQATKIAARIGGLFALLMAIVGVVTFSVTLILVALFVYVAATTESKMVIYSDLLRGIRVSDIMSRDGATIPVAASIEEVRDRMIKEGTTSYPVTDTAGEIVGVVRLEDLKDMEVASETRVGDIMTTEIETISAEADASEILAQFGRGQDDRLFVEVGGEVAGVITRDDLMTTLNILQGSEPESVPGVSRI